MLWAAFGLYSSGSFSFVQPCGGDNSFGFSYYLDSFTDIAVAGFGFGEEGMESSGVG